MKFPPNPSRLLTFDWESVKEQLLKCNPNDGNYYMISFNKGRDDEYRTRFMPYQEALSLVFLALEKKRLEIPITL